jgi:hypothetical protein
MLALNIDVGERQVDLGLSRVAVISDEERALAGVTVFHPAFATMSIKDCRQTARRLLDWLLG